MVKITPWFALVLIVYQLPLVIQTGLVKEWSKRCGGTSSV